MMLATATAAMIAISVVMKGASTGSVGSGVVGSGSVGSGVVGSGSVGSGVVGSGSVGSGVVGSGSIDPAGDGASVTPKAVSTYEA